MTPRLEILNAQLGRLLLAASKHNVFTSAHYGRGFGFQQAVSLTPRTFAFVEAISNIQTEVIQIVGERAARILFEEEISRAYAQSIERDRLVEEAKHETEVALPFAVVRQEPVGHGCFHTGVLGASRPLFLWVYDCGSWTKKGSLQKSIDQFEQRCGKNASRDVDIDLLFISHFDADHVSGLGMLLGLPGCVRLRVHTAVIPYVSPATSFEILLTAAAQGECSDGLVDAVVQPAKYCADRRIRRLIIMRPREPDADDGIDATPPWIPRRSRPESPSERELTSEFVRPDGTLLPTRTQNGVEIAEAPPGTVCQIVANTLLALTGGLSHMLHEWQHEGWMIRLDGLQQRSSGVPFDSHLDFNEKLIEKFRDAFHLLRLIQRNVPALGCEWYISLRICRSSSPFF